MKKLFYKIIAISNEDCVKKYAVNLLCLILMITAITTTEAAFKDTGWGVRPLGMGGAFTAIANDSNAPLFNPAGIAQVTQSEVSFMSAKLFTGLEGVDIGLNYFGYIHPMRARTGNFGLSWAALSSAGLYREDTACISYGRFLDDVVKIPKTCLAVGANVKFLRNEYDLDVRSQNDPVFANGSLVNAYTGDVGVWAGWQKIGLSAGIMSKNVTSPDIGLKTAEYVPNENVLGLAYYQERLRYIGLPYCTIALDLVNRKNDLSVRGGVESWFFDGKFAIRLGGRAQEATFGLGYEIELGRDTKLVVDYALAWPLEIEETNGSHRLGLTLRLP
jgi:hypothetical protein